MRVKVFAFMALLFFVIPVMAQGTTFVISPPGSDPAAFPDELPESVVYEQPDLAKCPGTDPNVTITDVERTCSTFENQPFVGTFTLPGKSARFSTAALPIFLTKSEGPDLSTLECVPPETQESLLKDFQNGQWNLLYPDLCAVTKVRPYVIGIFNLTDEPVVVGEANGFGSFSGDVGLSIFEPTWTPELVRAVVDLHLKKMVFENKDAEAAWASGNPYPGVNPANCTKVADLEANEVTYCPGVNVVEAIWDGTSWQLNLGAYGTTDDGKTFKYVDIAPLVAAHAETTK